MEEAENDPLLAPLDELSPPAATVRPPVGSWAQVARSGHEGTANNPLTESAVRAGSATFAGLLMKLLRRRKSFSGASLDLKIGMDKSI